MSQSIILIALLLVLLISCVVGGVSSVHAADDKVAQFGAIVGETEALKELEAHFLRSQSVGTLCRA